MAAKKDYNAQQMMAKALAHAVMRGEDPKTLYSKYAREATGLCEVLEPPLVGLVCQVKAMANNPIQTSPVITELAMAMITGDSVGAAECYRKYSHNDEAEKRTAWNFGTFAALELLRLINSKEKPLEEFEYRVLGTGGQDGLLLEGKRADGTIDGEPVKADSPAKFYALQIGTAKFRVQTRTQNTVTATLLKEWLAQNALPMTVKMTRMTAEEQWAPVPTATRPPGLGADEYLVLGIVEDDDGTGNKVKGLRLDHLPTVEEAAKIPTTELPCIGLQIGDQKFSDLFCERDPKSPGYLAVSGIGLSRYLEQKPIPLTCKIVAMKSSEEDEGQFRAQGVRKDSKAR